MTQDDIITDLTDLPLFEGIIGRKVEFEGLEYPTKSRKIFSILFKITHYRKDNPALDISAVKADYVKRLTATNLNFVDSEGNSIQLHLIPPVIENGIMIEPPRQEPPPEGSINEFDFWIYGILANPIIFWETIYKAMKKRVEEGYFDNL